MNNTRSGRRGEHVARLFCRRKRFRIIATNWRSGRGEIDIIARDGDTTVFIEVKMRTNDRFGAPEEALTPRKQRILRATIARYLAMHMTRRFRVDVLAIRAQRDRAIVRHIPDVLLLPH